MIKNKFSKSFCDILVKMACFRLRNISILILTSLNHINYSKGFFDFFYDDSFDCQTHIAYGNNYNRSNPDFVIATFITFAGNM